MIEWQNAGPKIGRTQARYQLAQHKGVSALHSLGGFGKMSSKIDRCLDE